MDCSTGCKALARVVGVARTARGGGVTRGGGVARGGGVSGVTGGGDKPVGVAAATRGDRAACGASTRLR